jgi:hypothetical protein
MLQTDLNILGEWAVENEIKIGKQAMQQLIIAFLRVSKFTLFHVVLI